MAFDIAVQIVGGLAFTAGAVISIVKGAAIQIWLSITTSLRSSRVLGGIILGGTGLFFFLKSPAIRLFQYFQRL
jgi:hypothetical protein